MPHARVKIELRPGGGDCVRTGTITRAGQSIVCLPEQVVVQLTGASADGPDVILG